MTHYSVDLASLFSPTSYRVTIVVITIIIAHCLGWEDFFGCAKAPEREREQVDERQTADGTKPSPTRNEMEHISPERKTTQTKREKKQISASLLFSIHLAASPSAGNHNSGRLRADEG